MAASGDAGTVSRVVLVGFMCSGKTSVGRDLARLLEWTHVDLDREVEGRAGISVAEIFARHGEARFREMEAEATELLAGREEVVLSPGGGWITRPELMDRLGDRTLSVWLQVSPEEVLRRAAAAPGERPLLSGPEPLETVRRLMEERDRHYRRAHLALPTDGRDPAHTALRILHEVQARGTRSGTHAAPS